MNSVAVVQQQIPRAVQAGLQRRAAARRGPGPARRCRRSVFTVLRLQIEGADQVVLAVGDIERVAVEGHALRIVERGLGEGAVVLPGSPVPATAIFLPSRSVMTMR